MAVEAPGAPVTKDAAAPEAEPGDRERSEEGARQAREEGARSPAVTKMSCATACRASEGTSSSPLRGQRANPSEAAPTGNRGRRGKGGRNGPATPRKPLTVTVTTASVETVTGVPTELDDFNVSLVDSAGHYRSFTRGPGVRVAKHDPYAAHVALLDTYTDKEIHDVVAYLETLQ